MNEPDTASVTLGDVAARVAKLEEELNALKKENEELRAEINKVRALAIAL